MLHAVRSVSVSILGTENRLRSGWYLRQETTSGGKKVNE
jgi:hypothetical protein